MNYFTRASYIKNINTCTQKYEYECCVKLYYVDNV